MSHLRSSELDLLVCLLAVFILSLAMTATRAVAGEAPSSVGKLTIAMDGWGSDMIDPWENPQPSFIQTYLNLRLVTRDENMQAVPLWATELSQNCPRTLKASTSSYIPRPSARTARRPTLSC